MSDRTNESLSAPERHRLLGQLTDVVGSAGTFDATEARSVYLDEFEFNAPEQAVAGAVAPTSTEQIRDIVRIASHCNVAIWPVSRGRNLGYGAAMPATGGSLILDLSRMNRILDVDARTGCCEIEPGVGFVQLFNYLRERKIPLWVSIPGNPLGSVLGNALERGTGFSPYGDHASKVCGLEVVLPNGELIRTGFGAITDGRCWHHFHGGFGPDWDAMFIQSNFGIVTRAGIWLMPQPDATLRARVRLPNIEDLAWIIDALAPLRLRSVIEHPIVIGNYLHEASVYSCRRDWHSAAGPVPDGIARRIRDFFRIGQWNFSLALYGYSEIILAQSQVIRAALEDRLQDRLRFDIWRHGEPLERSAACIPDTTGLKAANWQGGRGAHISFSPIIPADGGFALRHYERIAKRFQEFGLDLSCSFAVSGRHIANVNMIAFDRDNTAMTSNARALYRTLVEDAAREGIGEYRAHVDFMQSVSGTFDFNDHALRKLNTTIKDVLDPKGIIAPGKNGIWPSGRVRRDREWP